MSIPKSGNQIPAWLNEILTSAPSTVDHLLLIINASWMWWNNTQMLSLISYICVSFLLVQRCLIAQYPHFTNMV